ncbi:MAG: hypothetical protein ACLRPU_00675 [Enterococcus hulanensis]
MDFNEYKAMLQEMVDEDELMKFGDEDEIIYQIDNLTIYGGFDYGIRGVDHNVLLDDGVEWRNVLEWGTVVVPETRSYISNTEINRFKELGYERLPLLDNHIIKGQERTDSQEYIEMGVQSNERISDRIYSLKQLINAVNEREDGFYQIPDSELSIADNRFFNSLDIEHEDNEKVLILSMLELEKDYLLVGPDVVKWTDNWSGEGERIYQGNVMENFEISFDEESFKVNRNDLQFSKKSQQIEAPTVQIGMKNTNAQTSRANSHELDR